MAQGRAARVSAFAHRAELWHGLWRSKLGGLSKYRAISSPSLVPPALRVLPNLSCSQQVSSRNQNQSI